MFTLPLEGLTSQDVSVTAAESQRANVLISADLIMWDDIPMAHRFSIQALDATMKDLMRNDLIFGGKTIVFFGNWRRTGPIVHFGNDDDSVQ